MSDFPIFTTSAKKGEKGVGLVSRIINDDFHWLFKRNHQEHDFGIDGQIEVVTEEGYVTGQIIGAQIKFGESFFREKNRFGWIFRGEKKHFNYIANYPIPVFIMLCNPENMEVYWVLFVPEQVQGSAQGWQITVPFKNILRHSKDEILDFLPGVRDLKSELKEYWALNKLIMQSELFLCVLSKDEVVSRDVTIARQFLDRLLKGKELALHCMGKVEFSIHGYDENPLELWEMEDFVKFAPLLDQALKEIFFFSRTEKPAHFLRLLMFSQSQTRWIGRRPKLGKRGSVTFDPIKRAEFIGRHFLGLNEVTEWLGMTEAENAKISFRVIKHLGIEVPKDYEAKVLGGDK